MSIRDLVSHRIADGRLHRLQPRLASDPIERTVLYSTRVATFLAGPWDDRAEERRAERLRADLEMFVQGQVISVGWDPREKDNAAYMARLEPEADGMWDIRSRDPKPAIRVVGCFTETDVFVALDWGTRKYLDVRSSPQWRDLIVNSNAEWRSLFQPYPPHIGVDLHDYISNNVFLV